MALFELLKEHSFTRDLPEAHLTRLAALAREVVFEPDEIVFRAGERSAGFYLLISGSVSVEVSTSVYVISIQALGPGDAFGWSSLLSRHDTAFQTRARERSTTVCLDAAGLSKACGQDPELGFEFFRRLSELVAGRVRATELRLAEFCGIATSLPGAAAC